MSASHFSGPMNIGDGSYELVTGAKTLTSEDSGKTLDLASGTGLTVFLPLLSSVKKGFEVTLRVQTAPTGGDYVISSNVADAGTVVGNVVASDGLATDSEAGGLNNVLFVSASSEVGDLVTFTTNGGNWFAYGRCSLSASILFSGI